MAPLLVIDGDSLGHRAYHAMPSVEGAGGRPVGLLLGFANVLLSLLRATQPRAVIVCLDTYQLASDMTATLHPRPRGELERVDRAGVRQRYGIEPEQVPDLIALRGDPSDNIPGARGIGQKTAAELLRRHGDLEGVIAHAGELTPRQRLAIEGSAGDLRRYLDVATMRRDAAMTIPGDASLD